MATNNDPQSLIEYLATQVTSDSLLGLAKEKINALLEIIEQLNEVYQEQAHIDDISNFQEYVNELKEFSLKIKANQKVYDTFLNLITLFGTKIDQLNIVLMPPQEENDVQTLVKSFIGLLNTESLLGFDEEQIAALCDTINLINDVYQGYKQVKDLVDFQGKLDKLKAFLTKSKDNQQINNTFINLIKLFANKISGIDSILQPVVQVIDVQPLFESFVLQLRIDSQLNITEEKKNELLDTIDLIIELYQDQKKIQDFIDLQSRIDDLEAFWGISKKNKIIHKIYSDLLTIFGTQIEEIALIVRLVDQQNDAQPLIEELIIQVNVENFPELNEEKTAIFKQIIESLSKVYQGYKKIDSVQNLQEAINELEEFVIITEDQQEIHKKLLRLLGLFSNKIKAIGPILVPKDEKIENMTLFEALVANVHPNNFPYMLQEQIDDLFSIIKKFDKISRGVKVGDHKAFESCINKAHGYWLKIRDHKESRKVFVELITLFSTKLPILQDVLKAEVLELATDEEKSIEELCKKPRLRALELIKEKKKILDYFEDNPRATLKSFYKNKNQLEALGISISTIDVPKLYPEEECSRFKFFPTIKKLEELKNLKLEEEKIFEILIDLLPEAQSNGLLRAWKDVNPTAPIVQEYEDIIRIFVHTETKDQFLRAYLHLCISQDTNLSTDEANQIKKAFKVHNPQSLNENENLVLVRQFWAKLAQNVTLSKLVKLIISEAKKSNPSLSQIINEIELGNLHNSKAQRSQIYRGPPEEVIKPAKFEEKKLSDSKKDTSNLRKEEVGFRQHVEQLMKMYREKDGSETKELSTLLANIEITNNNVMNSVLISELAQKKDVYTLLSKNEYLHYFYRNSESIKDQPLLGEIKLKKKEFFNSVEQILTDYSPQDLETPEKIVEMKRRIGFELQVLCLPMIKHMISLYDKLLVTDPFSSLNQISKALSNVEGGNKNFRVDYETTKIIGRIFYKSDFWTKIGRDERTKLYKFLSSDEIALELKLTIEQSNIKKYFNEYLEGIFKTTQIQDVEFLKLVFIDSYNPDFVDYKLKDFVTRFLSRGFVQRNYTLSNHISMLFLETILFPYFVNQNYDDKQISNNLKKWRELVSNKSDDLLNIFDNLFIVAETKNNNAKFLEEVADQVCLILLDGYSYLTMATGKTIKTAVEWKSIALKEGYFNNLFLKLESSEHEKSTKKYAANTLIELVLSHKNLPEDLKNSVINRISIAFAN